MHVFGYTRNLSYCHIYRNHSHGIRHKTATNWPQNQNSHKSATKHLQNLHKTSTNPPKISQKQISGHRRTLHYEDLGIMLHLVRLLLVILSLSVVVIEISSFGQTVYVVGAIWLETY